MSLGEKTSGELNFMNFAVIGYGGQGAWHCDRILNSDVATLSGTYDIREARNEAARAKGIHVYDSLEALLQDTAVDAVVVATPNDSHNALVISALRRGKHVICEKPVDLTVAGFDAMVATAKEMGKVFTVHQNRRWDVDYLAMKGIVESGEIGDLIDIESRIHGSRGIPSDWRCEKAPGGGMILDWGVHLIDQILQIVKDPIVRVVCDTTYITGQEVDDGFFLTLHFASGKRAHIEVATYNFLPMPRFYLRCQSGSALIEDWRKHAQVARLTAWQEKDVTPVQNAAGITRTMAPRDELTLDCYEAPRPTVDVHDFYRNFCAVCGGKGELIVKPAEVRRVLLVMEAAFRSAECHSAVACSI